MIDSVLEILKLPLMIALAFYMSYVVSKNYQVKRLIQLSEDLHLSPESLSLAHNILITLPYFTPILLEDKVATYNNFLELSNSMILATSFILGILIYFSEGRYPVNYLLFTKSIIFSIVSYFSLLFTFMHNTISWTNIIFSYLAMLLFLYLSIIKSAATFRYDNSVYVRIDDYSNRFTRISGYFEILMRKTFDILCGRIPVLYNKDEDSINAFSLPLIVACNFVIFGFSVLTTKLIALIVIISACTGIFLRIITRSGKKHVITRLYGYLSSTYLVFLFTRALRRSIISASTTNSSIDRYFLQPNLRSISSYISVVASSAALFNSDQVDIAYLILITAHIPATFFSTGIAGSFLVATNNKTLEDLSSGSPQQIPTSIRYFPILYLLILTNCEIWGYRIRKDLGMFLILNFLFYIFCSIVRVLECRNLR